MRFSRSRIIAVVFSAVLVTGSPVRLLAQQQRVVVGASGNVTYSTGPTDTVVGAKGVVAVGARFEQGRAVDESYVVSLANFNAAVANAAETKAMRAVMGDVENLRGLKTMDQLERLQGRLNASIMNNIVTVPGKTFDLNAKAVGADLLANAFALDNTPQIRVTSSGRQEVLVPAVRNVLLLKAGVVPQLVDAGSAFAGFAVNRDPLAVQWGSSAHQVSLSLDGIQLIANPDGASSFGAAAGLSGGFVNGTLDLTTPQSSATSLFNLTLGVSGLPGAPTSTALDFGYFMDPNVDPSQYSIADSDGHTTLAGVQADLAAQFALARTDPATGDTYYGFNPGYSVTLGIPGALNSSPDSVLFLDNFGVATAAVPEPTSILLLGSGLLLALQYRRRASACRPRRVGATPSGPDVPEML